MQIKRNQKEKEGIKKHLEKNIQSILNRIKENELVNEEENQGTINK